MQRWECKAPCRPLTGAMGQGWQRVHSQPWDGSRTQSGPLMGSPQRAHSHPWLEGWALEVGGESPAPGNEPMALFRELGALGQHRPARGEEMAWQ